MFKLRAPSNALVAISEIPSIVVSDNPKDGQSLQNFVINAIVSARVIPRNALGLRVHDYRKSFQVSEFLVGRLADGIMEGQRNANPLTLSKRVSPSEAQIIARNELEKEVRTLAREFALKGFITTDDITRFLAEDGVGCEWEPASHGMILNADRSDSAQDVVQGDDDQGRKNDKPNLPVIVRKLGVMLEELKDIVPGIKSAINNAHRNGLVRAKLAEHGKWDMAAVLAWSFENKNIRKEKASQIIGTDPGGELSVALRQIMGV